MLCVTTFISVTIINGRPKIYYLHSLIKSWWPKNIWNFHLIFFSLIEVNSILEHFPADSMCVEHNSMLQYKMAWKHLTTYDFDLIEDNLSTWHSTFDIFLWWSYFLENPFSFKIEQLLTSALKFTVWKAFNQI